MLPLTRHALPANDASAAALAKQHVSQDHFSAHYEQAPKCELSFYRSARIDSG